MDRQNDRFRHHEAARSGLKKPSGELVSDRIVCVDDAAVDELCRILARILDRVLSHDDTNGKQEC
jgi:hypothetical protein